MHIFLACGKDVADVAPVSEVILAGEVSPYRPQLNDAPKGPAYSREGGGVVGLCLLRPAGAPTLTLMRLARGSKLITSWMAILAVLMMAFAPLVSQAVGANRAWLEICSASGPKFIQADAGSSDQPNKQSTAYPLEHCPYCSLHASALGMPPAPLVVLPVIEQRDVPLAFLSAPSTLHAWRTAQPRGPPFLA